MTTKHKAEDIQQGFFTVDQLNTQRELAQGQLRGALAQLDAIQKPDWPMAVEYGEEVRRAHIETNQRRIDYLQRRIAAINACQPRA